MNLPVEFSQKTPRELITEAVQMLEPPCQELADKLVQALCEFVQEVYEVGHAQGIEGDALERDFCARPLREIEADSVES